MNRYYNHIDVERNAQQFWKNNRCFKVFEDMTIEKYYCLSMFPYPSGNLHMGHVRNYSIGDAITRFNIMQGKNVLQPIGWDAFGMPAENAAIKQGISPNDWTKKNIDYMRIQLNSLGFAYDWDREFSTCEVNYYYWEQWFFTKLIKKDLVYKKDSIVNWDPVDNTVLSNEQVIDGYGWRSGAKIESRKISIWFLKITNYAEELLKDLDNLDWPERVKTMQRNWIGKSSGVDIDFYVSEIPDALSKLTIFTTRPDTLMGVSYLAISSEHPIANFLYKNNPKLIKFFKKYCNSLCGEADIENLGINIVYKANHPITKEKLPIYITNFVLMEYGHGAIMCVPAHDKRDWDFANKYSLSKIPVIADINGNIPNIYNGPYTKQGSILINSGEFNFLKTYEAFDIIIKKLEKKYNSIKRVNYRIRDWGISRQRYWGTPIPIKYGKNGEIIALNIDELPVCLPTNIKLKTNKSPLNTIPSFYNLRNLWTRETDTFDTFIESSWYYARFCCHDNNDLMLDERVKYWLPVDIYIGGIEHAILHLLYARFFHKLLRDFGLVHCDEPFKRLLTQGMVVANTYYRKMNDGSNQWFNHIDVKVKSDGSAYLISDGKPVIMGGIQKMSKSKNNGVDPQSMINQFGADTVRLFILFAAPSDQSLEWSYAGIEGAYRFLNRLWKFTYDHIALFGIINKNINVSLLNDRQRAIRRITHITIKKTTYDINSANFNTAIAAVMKLNNTLLRFNDNSIQGLAVIIEALEVSLLILSPIVPHITHVLWNELGHKEAIINARWPKIDDQALFIEEMTLVIQINGKLRTKIKIPADTDLDIIKKIALSDYKIQIYIKCKFITKIFIVPGKLINIVF
ncbi:Leucyl-tRNA synthetase [Candidatus Johnevansia muelleri]|uniref:Leucine--tRNA ligase n=1 Tax=Candidatus Johnevansia muelleri TaxID=1495769 RepID=A0A078KHJ9_9GAMM|nr:Leucyl-tRNA synthetase [Candidatus Evansia muelleri]